MLYYCARTMGGTSRGVGILKALGEGVLVTPYRSIAIAESLPWFRHPPLPLADDVLVYDRISRYRKRGKRIVIGREPLVDVDAVIDWPVVSHRLDELDLEDAEAWWSAPVMVGGNTIHSILEDPPKQRILAVRGGPGRKARRFVEDVEIASPKARLAVYHPRQFYWPALALMALADEVIGEQQVMNEWVVLRNRADPDGAKRAAAEIRKLL